MGINQGSKVGRRYSLYSNNNNNTQDYHAVIDMIVEDVKNRTRQGIQEWRLAIDNADHPDYPQWHQLQDMFEYLSTDAHLQSVFGLIRKGAVLSKRYYIRNAKTNQEDKDKTKLLEKEWFLKMVSEMLEAITRAYSIIQVPRLELLNAKSIDLPFDVLPKRQFIPQLNWMMTQVGGTEAYSITDPYWEGTIICVKGFDKFGAMNDIVPNLIWKKNAAQGWAIFSERFGIPLVKIETNKTAKADIDKLEAMAKKMGQAARAIIPTGSKLEVLDGAAKGDPYKVYQEQIKTHNEEISKRILGGTMITDNGSSRSQSEVMERTLDGKIAETDMKMIEFAVNDQLIPILIKAGLPFTEDDEFVYDRAESLSLSELWKIVEGLLGKGYQIEDGWLQEKFSIPVTGKTDPAPTDQPPVPPADQNKGKNPKAKGFFG